MDAGESAHPKSNQLDAKRERALRAAENLIPAHGFDGLRLRDVSKAANVSIGLLQHYFDTRDELLLETMRTASGRRAEQWTKLADSHEGASAKLNALLRGAIGDRHRCVVWIETCAASTRHPQLVHDVRRNNEEWHRALSETVALGVHSGDFTPSIPEDEAVEVLVALVDGLMLAKAISGASDPGRHQTKLLQNAARHLLGDGYVPVEPDPR